MLPRHLQSVGSRCFAQAGHSQFPNVRDFPRCPWWTMPYPQTQYQPVNTWHSWEYLRPHPYNQPPAFSGPCLPWAANQSSRFHLSPYNMNSAGDELTKKRKNAEKDDHGRKMWPKRSYPPAKDFSVPSVPPVQDPSGLVADIQKQVKVTTARRIWEDLSHLCVEPSRGKFDFSVASYNILSQELLEDNSYLYGHCHRPYLFWNYRLPNILKELEEMNADILCLQEVQEDHYQQQIKPSLEALGYLCEFKRRTGTKPDGCAICFKSQKFNLALVKPVEYFRKNVPLLDRDNVGLLLMLQPKMEMEAPTICVANTHLLFNPRRGDIKLAQLAVLLAEITEVAQMQDGKFCPIIMCGDFNAVPGSPLYTLIKEGKLNYEGISVAKVSGQETYHRGQRILPVPLWPKSLGITQNCVYEPQKDQERKGFVSKEGASKEIGYQRRRESDLQHHFSLTSVYSHFAPDTGVPEVTTCHSRTALTVDYIFYSAAVNDVSGDRVPCGGLQLLGRLSLLTEKDLWSVKGLPNETKSSDHLSLLAMFRLGV